MKEGFIARRLRIDGIVQGVGFRPFVYHLSRQYRLKGKVLNISSGVSLHIEGTRKDIESFSRDLIEKCPPRAVITAISERVVPIRKLNNFTIARSRIHKSVSTLISSDVSICDDCLRELFDPLDRRYRYPFINCTNCGPRYTIVTDIPYDRHYTSMAQFPMCGKCQAEYDDSENRRFHAQPNACADCGPRVTLHDNSGIPITTGDPIGEGVHLLKRGALIALKGIGGFHLVADAENSEAIQRLRKRKRREEKPLAIMSADVEAIRNYAHVDIEEEVLLSSPQRPIVLLRKKIPNCISEYVSPKNRYFGVMLPYTPLHYLVVQSGFTALVMTSGNISEEPMAIANDEAFNRLSGVADFFLSHNRDIVVPCDDSIVRHSSGMTRLIRRSRGYAPTPVFLNRKVPQILACGADMKNTICLTHNNKAFVSQHIGDLDNFAAYEYYRATIDHLKRLFRVEPEIVAYDLHPDYLSTRYGENRNGMEKIQVQHHHAHIASCMAENRLDGEVIGLSFDGTGYGMDGAIWGGEMLLADLKDFYRAGSLSYVAMPGSTRAIKEPWRMAVSYLYDAFGEDFLNFSFPCMKKVGDKKIQFIMEMISKRINSPLTSSLGRLFDGIAAILGIKSHVSYEGEAAVALEMMADRKGHSWYAFELEKDGYYRILPRSIIRGIVHDMLHGIPHAEICGKFHATIIRMYSELCERLRKETGLDRIVLSGGSFQNTILLGGFIKSLEEKRFRVYSHHLVPSNDGGLCLGQAMVAASKSRA
jgi:hydrogenase maturation protein HypF